MESLSRGAVPFGIAREHNDRLAVYLTLEIRPAQRVAPYQTILHEPTPDDALEVAIQGEAWIANADGSRDRRRREGVAYGQIVDTLRLVGSARALRVAELWDRWHLNGMRAACVHQTDAAAAIQARMRDYGQDRERWALLSALPCPAGYRYGSAWLYEPVPAAVLDELRRASGPREPASACTPASYGPGLLSAASSTAVPMGERRMPTVFTVEPGWAESDPDPTGQNSYDRSLED